MIKIVKNEKLKKLDVGETKGVSGGTIYSAPSSFHGKDRKGNIIKVYYVADKSSPSGVSTFYSEKSAKDFAESNGISTTIVNVATESEANKLSTSLPNRF